MEAVTGIVTVAQLIGSAVTLINTVIRLYQRLKGNAVRLKDHLERIETLHHVVRIIENNNNLLVKEKIRAPLEQLVRSIQNLKNIIETLQSHQNKSRLARLTKASTQTTDFENLEENLRHIESDKLALILCITHAHAAASLEDRQPASSRSSQSGFLTCKDDSAALTRSDFKVLTHVPHSATLR